MAFNLSFEKLSHYDAGKVGISVKVQLKLIGAFAEFEAKIDTGSTFCVFQRMFGEKLGLDIESGEPQRISTSTGSFLAFGHSVTLVVENFEFDVLVFFAEDEYFSRNVLGRRGFLDRVVIAIDDYDGKFYLSQKRYDE